MQARQLCALLLVGGLSASFAATANAQNRSWRNQGWRDQQESRGRQMQYRNMDADGDGVITRAEWRGSLVQFQQQDTNNDNVLSGAEIWSAQQQPTGDDDMTRVFERADRNNDRLLSRDEWYGDLQTFERIDSNDDGRISLSEFLGDQVEGTTGEQQRTPAYRAGFTRGLAEGREAGRQDKTINGGRWDLEGQRELQEADSGYTTAVGPRDEYQAGYRIGFRRGYAQGFGPR